MCGIAGILNFDGSPVDSGLIQAMTDIMVHRGPDGEGQWTSGPVGLGHRRLSIIDLSAEANQPMLSEDARTAIVFNGEIYNYRDLTRHLEEQGVHCRTTSDTEVIIHLYRLYGPDCVSRLRGMFAFAIWDEERQRLFLARDRVGIKPLYFLRNDRQFVFGSEVKTVVASGYSERRISRQALAGLSRFLVVPQPNSIFTDIHKLEPGRSLLIEANGACHERVYWEPPAFGAEDGATEAEWMTRLDERLNESIRYHMIADVPVSAFLSGGLDSSAVVTLMRRQAPEASLDSFSITFPGQGQFDEGPFARRVAEHNGIGHHVGTINENFLDDVDDMAWYLDEPFAISSAFATYYLARHAAQSTKVVLTGDGGDELFAGYEGYKNDAYLSQPAVSTMLGGLYELLFAVSKATGADSSMIKRLMVALRRRLGSEGLRYSERSAQNSLFANSLTLRPEYFHSMLANWKDNLMAGYYDGLSTDDRLSRKLFAEYKTRLVDEMLMKVDRMTMAHSLEARVPLLDHEIVEFAFSVPSELKLHPKDGDAETKYLFKRTMEAYLPRDIIYRDKQGFNLPVRNWMQGRFIESICERLAGGRLESAGVIDPDGVRTIASRQNSGQGNFSNMLLVLLVLETWIGGYEKRFGGISWS